MGNEERVILQITITEKSIIRKENMINASELITSIGVLDVIKNDLISLYNQKEKEHRENGK